MLVSIKSHTLQQLEHHAADSKQGNSMYTQLNKNTNEACHRHITKSYNQTDTECVTAALNLRKQVFSVSFIVNIFQSAELQKVCGPMHFTVVLPGVGQLEAVSHARAVLDSLEIVVPAANIGHHVEAHESVTEKHLNLLIVGGQVASWVAAVFVLPAPLVPPRSQLVRSQSAAARSETACDDNAALSIPALVALKHLGMSCHIL